MNLFELSIKIGAEDKASKVINEVSNKARNLGDTFNQNTKNSNTFNGAISNLSGGMKNSGKDIDSYSGKLTQFKKTAQSAGNALLSFGKVMGSGIATAAKVGLSAIGSAAAGIAALTTVAVKSYAEYEQLIGGAELMFGEAFGYVEQRAQEAYKTVQLSQNEYLKQVNGFATGLKVALGGDEQAAAELADRIVQAEADIIAATGNAAENVQNAFNGIMRSNFTMLDNLQIGIKPTKEGFQEVIDKVNEWNAANGKATAYQMDNLADMQSALIDYIDMVGYSGYAQMEASKTIQGSLSSMKGAWTNLLNGVADDTADFQQLTENFVESIGVVAENIMPRIENVLDGAIVLIDTLVPQIVDRIPYLVESVLPKLANSGVEIVRSLLNGISENKETIVNSAIEVVMFLSTSILDMLPEILLVGMEVLTALANGIADELPTLIPVAVDAILQMADVLTAPENLIPLLDAGLSIILALGDGIINSIPSIVEQVPQIIDNLVKSFGEFAYKLVDAGIELGKKLLKGLGESIKSGIGSIGESIASAFGIDVGNDIGATISEGTTTGISENSNGGKTVNVTQNIYSEAKSAAELMREATLNQEMAVLMGV